MEGRVHQVNISPEQASYRQNNLKSSRKVDTDRADFATDISGGTPTPECGRIHDSGLHKQKLRVCRFYTSSSCKYGEQCKFYHPKRPSKTPCVGVQSRRAPTDLNFGMFMKASKSRPPVVRPESTKCKTADGLQQVELEQLTARFPAGKHKVIEKGKHRIVYRITFTPTDPDWMFAFKNVDLLVDIPNEYPLKPLSVVVPDDQPIPKECVISINSAITGWTATHESGSLMLRPFLHWLDRVITMLVTDSLPEDVDTSAAQVLSVLDLNTNEDGKADEELQASNGPELEKLQTSDEHEKSPIVLGTKRGTEVRLKDLTLGQNVATVIFSNVKLVAECTRCKFSQDIAVTAESPMSSMCSRCHTCMSATYHQCLIHANSITMGYMDLLGCVASDVILMDSNMTIACLECGRDNTTKGFYYGQSKDVWCRRCHSKLTVYAEQCKFVQHQPRELIQVAHEVPKHVKLKQKERIFKLGTPLPENGTCQHYKKSHRWLRFPCCGKAYACDVCHDSKEDHPMERANRMICGYCSQEQVYTTSKPCTRCGFGLAVVKHSAYWEGGLGCRDKVKMNRNDKHKFSQSGDKTSSKHLERVGVQGKKNKKH